MVSRPRDSRAEADVIAEMEEEDEEEEEDGMTAEQKGTYIDSRLRFTLTSQLSLQHRCRSLEHS